MIGWQQKQRNKPCIPFHRPQIDEKTQRSPAGFRPNFVLSCPVSSFPQWPNRCPHKKDKPNVASPGLP